METVPPRAAVRRDLREGDTRSGVRSGVEGTVVRAGVRRYITAGEARGAEVRSGEVMGGQMERVLPRAAVRWNLRGGQVISGQVTCSRYRPGPLLRHLRGAGGRVR